MDTPDLYGGSAVTTKNIYKLKGESTWTQVAGAATFNADPGDVVQIQFGIGDAANEDDAEPYGCYAEWVVPCKSYPDLKAGELCVDKDGKSGVIDDSLATDLDVLFFDENDGNSITESDTMDIDAAELYTIEFEWKSDFEEDFGSRYCEDLPKSLLPGTKGNVMVAHVNTSCTDNVHIESKSGERYLPYTGGQLSRLLATVSGYTDYAFVVPTLRSNVKLEGNVVWDTDDTVGCDGGTSNATFYLYDVNTYLDNDVTPATVKCGIMDEDANEVGAAAADSFTFYVEDD